MTATPDEGSLPASFTPAELADRLDRIAAKDLDDYDCWDQQAITFAGPVIRAMAEALADGEDIDTDDSWYAPLQGPLAPDEVNEVQP